MRTRVAAVAPTVASVSVLAICVACFDAVAPLARGDLVIVAGAELPTIPVVSLSRGAVVTRIGPIPPYKDQYALSPDSSRVYLSTYDPTSGVQLAVLDLRSFSVLALEPMSAIGARSVVGPVRPVGSYGMAVSPDGTKLLIDGVTGDSTEWLTDRARAVVIVDLGTLTPVAVRGPFSVSARGIIPVGVGTGGATQRILLLGTRPGPPTSALPQGLLLSGPDLALTDSVQFGVPVGDAIPANSGRELFLLSTTEVYRYDLSARQLVDSGPRPSSNLGNLCAAPDGQRLYLTDYGDYWDFPGSGRVAVYDARLRPLTSVDLGAGTALPPTLNNCGVSRDGRLLFVSSGTGSRGPLYPAQPGRLFIVDRMSGLLVRTVDLGDWASRQVFTF